MKYISAYLLCLVFGLSVLAVPEGDAAAQQPAAAVGQPQNNKKTDANITGHVIDESTGEHIPFIAVSLKGTTLSVLSDETGHFFLKNLPEGEFVLSASGIGYSTAELPVRTVRNKTIEINLKIKEEALSLDQVVISATKNETNKKSTATIVNVMSAKQFETNAASTMSETMNFQSGLRMENNCANCGMPQLRINGLEGKYSQILLDSRPIFSSLATVYGLEQLPVSMIERVEVIRGGGSALFGSSAIGGVVNIITKEPLRNSLSLSNTTNLYTKGVVDMSTSLNGSFVSDNNKAGIYLFGMVRNRDPYDRNGDGFSDAPKLSSETIGFRGYYKTSLFTKLTAEYHRIHEFRRGGDMMERPPHEANIAEQLEHTIDGGGLKFDGYTRNQKHRFSAYASAQKINRNSYFGTDQNPDAYGRTKDITALAGVQYLFSAPKFLIGRSDLTVGLEYSHNKLTDDIIGYDRHMHQITNIIGAFIQNEWKTDKFNFLIGGRLDKHNKVKNVIFSPRVTARYSPIEAVGLRASYSSGYLAPQAYDEDLHVTAVGGEVSLIELDPNLKPEYSHSFSASADLYHNFGKLQANLLIEGFYTAIKDVFTLTEYGHDAGGNLILRRENASGARIRGINFEAKAGIPKVFEVQLGYTLQKSRYKEPFEWTKNPDVKPQKIMFRSPDHYGYLTSNFFLTKNFSASLFGNYTGKMLVQHMAGYIPEDREVWAPRFFDLGFKLSYRFRITETIELDLYGGIKNILDQYQKDIDKGHLKDGGYIYGPAFPRLYFFGARFSL